MAVSQESQEMSSQGLSLDYFSHIWVIVINIIARIIIIIRMIILTIGCLLNYIFQSTSQFYPHDVHITSI